MHNVLARTGARRWLPMAALALVCALSFGVTSAGAEAPSLALSWEGGALHVGASGFGPREPVSFAIAIDGAASELRAMAGPGGDFGLFTELAVAPGQRVEVQARGAQGSVASASAVVPTGIPPRQPIRLLAADDGADRPGVLRRIEPASAPAPGGSAGPTGAGAAASPSGPGAAVVSHGSPQPAGPAAPASPTPSTTAGQPQADSSSATADAPAAGAAAPPASEPTSPAAGAAPPAAGPSGPGQPVVRPTALCRQVLACTYSERRLPPNGYRLQSLEVCGANCATQYWVSLVDGRQLLATDPVRSGGLLAVGRASADGAHPPVRTLLPHYATGDPACCPSADAETEYTWDGASGALVAGAARLTPAGSFEGWDAARDRLTRDGFTPIGRTG